jgi:polysaccharide pyruvyl transferase WcaK-like protein
MIAPPRVALVGTFDVDNFGDHLFPRIAIRELEARLPGITVDCYSPLGPLHPTRFRASPPAGGNASPSIHPRGPWFPSRLDRFAEAYDALLVGGGELLHLNDPLLSGFYGADPAEIDLVQPSRWFLEGLGGRREERCTVLWNAIGVPYDLTAEQSERVRDALRSRLPAVVRDPFSRDRLLAAGVTPPVDVVPDSGFLVDRLFGAERLSSRIASLRSRRAFPTAPALVVQGCDLLVPFAAAIATEVGRLAHELGLEPVLLETGRCRGDGDFADAVASHFAATRTAHCRVPADADLDDVAAVVSSGALFVGSSLHGAITALVHRRPFVVLNLGDESKLRGFGRVVGLEGAVIESTGALGAAARAAWAASAAGALDPILTGLQAAVDRHFDDVAAVVAEGAARRAPDERPRPSAVELEREALLAHVDVLRGQLGWQRNALRSKTDSHYEMDRPAGHGARGVARRLLGRLAQRFGEH